MMKTIYLTGQNNFGNRGCEALVRSTVTVLGEALGPVRVMVPSLDPRRDAAQWPGHERLGVEFVRAYPMPRFFSKLGGACQRFESLHRMIWPRPRLQPEMKRDLLRADVLLSIGGDNYSLDYGLASLYYFAGIAEFAQAHGKKAVLWGASVGPFSKSPVAEQRMVQHLAALDLVTVRESRSIDYLAGLGIRANMVPVIDSAFAMQPEPFDMAGFWPQAKEGVLGLNIGALIDSLRRRNGDAGGAVDAAAVFVRRVLAETGLSVLLVPHVAPLDGQQLNNDEVFNQRLLQALGDAAGPRLGLVPGGLNAAQLKHVISRCRFLIAGRTHATIAAFSSGVPTVSIAYSVKAKGINRDLFDSERYVLETPALSAQSLWTSLQHLLADEAPIRALYTERLPDWRHRARAGAVRLAELLR